MAKKDICNIHVLVGELKKLNPEAKIETVDYGYIKSSIPGNELALPSPFYYNEKNGITNKHKTQSGVYLAVYVGTLDEYPPTPI